MAASEHRRPSMHDVAALAGVSIGTVSYTLNRPERVSEATRARVLASIEELGFVPNSAARSMKAGGTTGLGIVVGDIRHTFSIELARGAQAAATEAGTTLLIANGNTDMVEQSRYVELFDQARMEGIILVPTYDAQRDIDQLRAHRRRVVIVNYRSTPADLCSVLMDNVDAGEQATRYLLERGCRRIGFLTRTAGLQPLDDRLIGIRRAVDAAGAELTLLEENHIYEEDGYLAAARLLSEDPAIRPDGIVVGTALMAQGLVLGLRAGGVRVPDDIRVISTEENVQAADIQLPTMKEPAFEMGAEAARMTIAESREGSRHLHRVTILRAELVRADAAG